MTQDELHTSLVLLGFHIVENLNVDTSTYYVRTPIGLYIYPQPLYSNVWINSDHAECFSNYSKLLDYVILLIVKERSND